MIDRDKFESVARRNLDARKRIALGKAAMHERYDISVNDIGEILLVPLVTIPANKMGIDEYGRLLGHFRKDEE